jgi:putative transposase
MNRKYKFRDNCKLYFVSFAVVYWIDVFIRNDYKRMLLDSLRYCQEKKGLELYAYCIMTSHVHLIIGSQTADLSAIMRDLKSYTSSQLRKTVQHHPGESRKEWMLWMMERAGKQNSNNTNFQFWQQHNHPIELSDPMIMQQKLNYIHNNPVEAGFVDTPEFYTYSSARDYAGEKGLIEISLIE